MSIHRLLMQVAIVQHCAIHVRGQTAPESINVAVMHLHKQPFVTLEFALNQPYQSAVAPSRCTPPSPPPPAAPTPRKARDYPFLCASPLQPIRMQTSPGKVEVGLMHVLEAEPGCADLGAMLQRNPLHTFMFDTQGNLLNANKAAFEAFQSDPPGANAHGPLDSTLTPPLCPALPCPVPLSPAVPGPSADLNKAQDVCTCCNVVLFLQILRWTGRSPCGTCLVLEPTLVS